MKLAALDLNLICVPDSVIDKVESVVGSLALLFYHSYVLTQGLLCVLELSLQPLDVLLVHHLSIRLLESNFTSQILHLAICLGLNPRDLFLLTCTPNFVQITEKCVHECLGDISSTSVSEVVRHSVSLIWYPFITILGSKAFVRITLICDCTRFLSGGLIRRGSLLGWVRGIHVPNTGAAIQCKLCELIVLRGL